MPFPKNNRESLIESPAEDRLTEIKKTAPRDQANAKKPPKCRRQTPRQATSTVAYEHEPPSPDDPLLSFAPVPHTRPRRNSITPDLQRAFIAHLAATGIVQSAARHIGKSMEALYKLRQSGFLFYARASARAMSSRKRCGRPVGLAVG